MSQLKEVDSQARLAIVVEALEELVDNLETASFTQEEFFVALDDLADASDAQRLANQRAAEDQSWQRALLARMVKVGLVTPTEGGFAPNRQHMSLLLANYHVGGRVLSWFMFQGDYQTSFQLLFAPEPGHAPDPVAPEPPEVEDGTDPLVDAIILLGKRLTSEMQAVTKKLSKLDDVLGRMASFDDRLLVMERQVVQLRDEAGELRLQKLTAGIDALTGGWFSKRIGEAA